MLVGGLKLPQDKRTVEAILRIDVGVSFLRGEIKVTECNSNTEKIL